MQLFSGLPSRDFTTPPCFCKTFVLCGLFLWLSAELHALRLCCGNALCLSALNELALGLSYIGQQLQYPAINSSQKRTLSTADSHFPLFLTRDVSS